MEYAEDSVISHTVPQLKIMASEMNIRRALNFRKASINQSQFVRKTAFSWLTNWWTLVCYEDLQPSPCQMYFKCCSLSNEYLRCAFLETKFLNFAHLPFAQVKHSKKTGLVGKTTSSLDIDYNASIQLTFCLLLYR